MRALLRPTQDQRRLARRVQNPGVPRVNIQNDHGKAKPYQVRQVLAAIEKEEAAE